MEPEVTDPSGHVVVERVEASVLAYARLRRAAAGAAEGREPNFGLLAENPGWRTSWSTIVTGRFSASSFSGLLFVEEGTGYAELYDTDGSGRLTGSPVATFDPLGGRSTWTHVVPGLFGPSSFTGLLLYDANEGLGRFYGNDGH